MWLGKKKNPGPLVAHRKEFVSVDRQFILTMKSHFFVDRWMIGKTERQTIILRLNVTTELQFLVYIQSM